MQESTVAGIPCLIRVDYFFKQKPLGPSADSDYDCDGYTEITFAICDRRGRPAPWSDRKLTIADKERIETEIEEAYQ